MARQIEGEGLEADVENVPTVEVEPVEETVDNGYEPMVEYVFALDRIFKKEDRYQTDPSALAGVAPFARFNREGNLVFKDIPRDTYFELLAMTSPRIYKVIMASDLKDSFGETVDLSSTFNDENDPSTEKTQSLGLKDQAVNRAAYQLGHASENVILIPSVKFLSLYFDDSDKFRSYASVVHHGFETIPYFARRTDTGGLFSLNTEVPSEKKVFSLSNLEKSLEQGIMEFGDLISGYQVLLNAGLSWASGSERVKGNLAKILMEKRPELFYGSDD